MTAPRTRLPFRVILVALILPLLITASGVALVLGWHDELPDPMATHWGLDGPDGFGPLWLNTLVYVVAGLGLLALFGGLLFAGRRSGFTLNQKVLAVASLTVSIVLTGIAVGTAAIQRGLEDAADAPDIGPVLLVSFMVAAVAGVAAWFLLPPASKPAADLTPAEPLRLAPEERAAWIGTARMSPSALVVISLAVVLVLGVSVFVIARTGGAAWPLLFLPLLLLVALTTTTAFRVLVDPTSLTVRAPLGWPTFRVPVDDIARVGTTDVAPTADFGGWGIRQAPGRRFGVIMRSGPAIEVERRDGRIFVVTVDDAATGAALLAAYAAAQRQAE